MEGADHRAFRQQRLGALSRRAALDVKDERALLVEAQRVHAVDDDLADQHIGDGGDRGVVARPGNGDQHHVRRGRPRRRWPCPARRTPTRRRPVAPVRHRVTRSSPPAPPRPSGSASPRPWSPVPPMTAIVSPETSGRSKGVGRQPYGQCAKPVQASPVAVRHRRSTSSRSTSTIDRPGRARGAVQSRRRRRRGDPGLLGEHPRCATVWLLAVRLGHRQHGRHAGVRARRTPLPSARASWAAITSVNTSRSRGQPPGRTAAAGPASASPSPLRNSA